MGPTYSSAGRFGLCESTCCPASTTRGLRRRHGVHVAEQVRALRARDDGPSPHVRRTSSRATREEGLTSSYADLAELSGANAALPPSGSTWRSPPAAPGPAGPLPRGTPTWPGTCPRCCTTSRTSSARTFARAAAPWKAEQLGGGHAISSMGGADVVRGGGRGDRGVGGDARRRARVVPAIDPARVHVVHNGIDTADWSPQVDPARVRELGSTPTGRRSSSSGGSPGRRACRSSCARALPCPPTSRSSCSPAPRHPEIMAEVEEAGRGPAVLPVRGRLDPGDAAATQTSSRSSRPPTAFACPSIHEPLGIVNLEAMACETARRATATGGIPRSSSTARPGPGADRAGHRRHRHPLDPDRYVADFAAALTAVVSDPDRAAQMGRAGRDRAISSFSWDAIAERTVEVYRSVPDPHPWSPGQNGFWHGRPPATRRDGEQVGR